MRPLTRDTEAETHEVGTLFAAASCVTQLERLQSVKLLDDLPTTPQSQVVLLHHAGTGPRKM